MTDPNATRIRIGGKTYSGLEDLPPDVRKQFEQMVGQMRDSGLLDDKNQDGIPDRFETPLRIAGWLGKLTGNPQLKERLQQQFRAFGASVGTTASTTTRSRASSGATRSQPVSTPHAPARTRTTTATNSSQVSARPVDPAQQGTRVTRRNIPQSVVQRSGQDPRDDTSLREFLRKLAIVSAIVFAGYAALRLLGGG